MSDEHIVVNTAQGSLKGYTRTSSLTGKKFLAFEGIPFAKPPVGDLRFKAPEPHEGWDGVRDALEEGAEPLQPAMFPDPTRDPTEMTLGDEDCLYLSVFTLQVPQDKVKTKLRPVIVSIHGGAFLLGSSKSNGPDYMMAGNVVFVNFSYRCGAFGFLSLETKEAPGNMGLKDQAMALRWVNQNIACFGGDSGNVTIMGISAGGASVHYHMMSPMSRGLFHKAIIQSGFAVNPWAVQRSPRQAALDLALVLGCNSVDNQEVLDFLKGVPAKKIVEATLALSKVKKYERLLGLIFLPCTEKASAQSFLTEHPEILIATGKLTFVPVLLGVCLKEGAVIVFFDGIKEAVFKELNQDHELLVPTVMGLEKGSAKSKQAAEEIWQFYMKGKEISWDNASDYIKYQGDKQFNLGFLQSRASLLRFSSQSTFTYLFTNHQRCICKAITSSLPIDTKAIEIADEETCHGADSMFLYTSTQLPFPGPTEEQKKAILRHVHAWSSFAAKGDPNCSDVGVSWPADSASSPRYMDIGPSWQAKQGLPFSERLHFWQTLGSKYGGFNV